MNKSQLTKALAERASISNDEAATVVNIFFETIKDALRRGDRVEIRGFGSFKLKDYDGYMGRNPNTGDTVQVKPKRLPFFKVGKHLKEHINH